MDIRRERPSQRLHHRLTAPISVWLEDLQVRVIDWSLGGIRVTVDDNAEAAAHRPVEAGDVLTGRLALPFQGFDLSWAFAAEVVRVDQAERQIALRFIELNERAIEVLRHFSEGLIRGSMVPVEDTILRIDSPVTPVSKDPDPNPVQNMSVKRWPFGVIIRSAFYLTAGLATLIYCAVMFYGNFLRMEIESAVVSAPIEAMIATADGRIQEVRFQVGQTIGQGFPAIVIESPKLEEQIDRARISIERATMELYAKRQTLRAEQAKLDDYRKISEAIEERRIAEIRGLEERAALARAQMLRFQRLLKRGHTTRTLLDEKRAALMALETELRLKRLQLREHVTIQQSIGEGRFYNGDRFDGQVAELKAEVDLLLDEIAFAEKEYEALLQHQSRLVIRAPQTGRLIELKKSVSSSVARGEEIALFERNEARTVQAYLNQEEILSIGLGDGAVVFFPSINERVDAKVVAIDRTSGYIDEIKSRYDWRAPKDRSGKVTLALQGFSPKAIRKRFPPGLPATVIFERRQVNEILARPARWLAGAEESAPPSDVPNANAETLPPADDRGEDI